MQDATIFITSAYLVCFIIIIYMITTSVMENIKLKKTLKKISDEKIKSTN